MDINFSNQVPSTFKNPMALENSSNVSDNYEHRSDSLSNVHYEDSSFNQYKPSLTTINESRPKEKSKPKTNFNDFFNDMNQNTSKRTITYEQSTPLKQLSSHTNSNNYQAIQNQQNNLDKNNQIQIAGLKE